jgi:hypothetical protein
MQTGTIIDLYDDPMGSVLKTKVAYAQLPDYIRSADYQTEEKLASLPDDAFALIMVDNGKAMRKFACVDKGNTALSVLYFMETKDKLPEEAQKIAAANLLGYCMAFGLEVPSQVAKIAGVVDFVGKRPALAGAIGVGALALHTENKRAQNNARIGTQMALQKNSDATGSEIMPLQSNPNKADDADSQLNASKTASLYVDVTGKTPEPRFTKKASINYALHKYGQGRFPLDSYGDVLEANRWFEENGKTLHPSDRQEYCTKLAARADQLGISVTTTIRKYASNTFAPEKEVRAAVSTRMQFWQSDSPERDALQGMIDKYASATPDAFCKKLAKFDEDHGLNHYWDDYVIDPWASTFGFEKKAEWTWEQGADRLTDEVLTRGIRDGKKIHEICTLFGKDLASEIVENPNTVFDSLPLDSKRIIARILNDSQ